MTQLQNPPSSQEEFLTLLGEMIHVNEEVFQCIISCEIILQGIRYIFNGEKMERVPYQSVNGV